MPRPVLAFLTLVWIATSGWGFPVTARAAGPFSDWAVIVVAGDWHTHKGAPSEVFDNARHDVGKALLNAGFSAANLDSAGTIAN